MIVVIGSGDAIFDPLVARQALAGRHCHTRNRTLNESRGTP